MIKRIENDNADNIIRTDYLKIPEDFNTKTELLNDDVKEKDNEQIDSRVNIERSDIEIKEIKEKEKIEHEELKQIREATECNNINNFNNDQKQIEDLTEKTDSKVKEKKDPQLTKDVPDNKSKDTKKK